MWPVHSAGSKDSEFTILWYIFSSLQIVQKERECVSTLVKQQRAESSRARSWCQNGGRECRVSLEFSV